MEPTRQRFPRGSQPNLATLNERYTVDDKIGEGGFCRVYRGTQVASGRRVAIKVPTPARRRDLDLVARFRREALMLCSLRDPHTVTAYDFDQTSDGMPFLVLELLEGRTLRETLLHGGPLAWARVRRILLEVCSSLTEAHVYGIVHRDLKPDNVFLEQRPIGEFVKVLDFGIAKPMFSDPELELTAIGETCGTAHYMSPEQRMGASLDGQSDIYSLGVLAYELLCGTVPFEVRDNTLPVLPPVAPSRVNRSICVPPQLEAIVLRCLELDKKKRFRSVPEVIAALDAITVTSTSFYPSELPDTIVMPASKTCPDALTARIG